MRRDRQDEGVVVECGIEKLQRRWLWYFSNVCCMDLERLPCLTAWRSSKIKESNNGRDEQLSLRRECNFHLYLFRHSQWLLKTTRRCCGSFAISAPWHKWLYLLTEVYESGGGIWVSQHWGRWSDEVVRVCFALPQQKKSHFVRKLGKHLIITWCFSYHLNYCYYIFPWSSDVILLFSRILLLFSGYWNGWL